MQQHYYAKLPPAAKEQVRLAYHAAESRLLLLDYDGTLVPFARRPQQARPGQALLNLLTRLSADPRTTLVIISGRQRAVLDEWFGTLPIGLVAGTRLLDPRSAPGMVQGAAPDECLESTAAATIPALC